MNSQDQKKRFIAQLARFLSDNLAGKSILLEMETKHPKPGPLPNLAKEWAELRSASPVHGWSDVKSTEETLLKFFN